MRYETKVTVVTGGKEYKPGSLLPADISDADLDFLKSKGFVTPTEKSPPAVDGLDEDRDISGFQEGIPGSLKMPGEIRKIRSKKEVASYAASIGLDLGEGFGGKGLRELQEEVVNFQEENMTEDSDYDMEDDEVYEVI